MRRLTVLPLAVLLAASLAGTQAAAQAANADAPARQLKWGPGPPSLPPGATLAVVDGDPSQAGPFTVRLRFPSGYRIRPHSHPSDETVTVRRGTLHAGMGDTWTTADMQRLIPGETKTMPANMNHYVRAVGRTELEVKGTGPFETTYANPADDPRNKKKGKGKTKVK
jgi:quercetin dioxygenase-like cupin family protein